jgi:CRP-like cAMP-binding protein
MRFDRTCRQISATVNSNVSAAASPPDTVALQFSRLARRDRALQASTTACQYVISHLAPETGSRSNVKLPQAGKSGNRLPLQNVAATENGNENPLFETALNSLPHSASGAAMENEERVRRAPVYAPAASEDVLFGGQLLRRAFLASPILSANRGAVLIASDAADPPGLLIIRGLAYRSVTLPDGQRSIADLILPNEIAGIDHAVLAGCNHEIVAAGALGYRLLKGAQMRELMRDPRVTLRALALAGEARWRADSHLSAITRLDARGRIAWMILDILERMRRQNLISRPTFNLPLTQDQIADYLGMTMVHVSRTFRRMREERLVLVDRHVVIILDHEGLRRAATGVLGSEPEGDRPSSQTNRELFEQRRSRG